MTVQAQIDADGPALSDWLGGDLVEEACGYAQDLTGPVRGWVEGLLGPAYDHWPFARLAWLRSGYVRLGVGVARVEFAPPGHGLASSWQPVDAPDQVRHGAAAVTVPLWQGGRIVDLLALHPLRPELWACRTGAAPALLGLAAEDLPYCRQVLAGAPLRVCRTPLDWLRHLLAAHLAWQRAVRRAWPEVVARACATIPAGADRWARLRWAQHWLTSRAGLDDPALPREPGAWDAVCLLDEGRAEMLFAGLSGLVCDSAGHAKALADAMAAQRRRRRAAEPALPECAALQDLRGAA